MLINLVYIFIPNHIINQYYRKVSLDSPIVYIIIWLVRGGEILVRRLRGGRNSSAHGKRGGGAKFLCARFSKTRQPPPPKNYDRSLRGRKSSTTCPYLIIIALQKKSQRKLEVISNQTDKGWLLSLQLFILCHVSGNYRRIMSTVMITEILLCHMIVFKLTTYAHSFTMLLWMLRKLGPSQSRGGGAF